MSPVVGISQEQHLHHADQGNPLLGEITSQSTTSLPTVEFDIAGQRVGLCAAELFRLMSISVPPHALQSCPITTTSSLKPLFLDSI